MYNIKYCIWLEHYNNVHSIRSDFLRHITKMKDYIIGVDWLILKIPFIFSCIKKSIKNRF